MTSEHIQLSIKRALEGQSNLSQEQLAVRGFSCPPIRRLFNHLCNIEGGVVYLEVGLFCGATFVSSFNPNLTAIGIEDHSQDFSEGFELVKKELKENIDKFSDRAKEVYVHYEDCFKIDKDNLPDNIDIFFYDGNHSEENQAKALPYFFDKMADKFIFIVDDFNWPEVFNGTNRALAELAEKIDVEYAQVLRGYQLQNDPIWHNGLCVYLIKKK